MINQIKEAGAAYSEPDKNLIWSRFKRGDKEAYAFIYREYSPLLFRYGRKIIYDRDLVKDCMHDLFVELWKNRNRLGDPPSIKNYLVKSLRNKLLRQINRNLKVLYKGDILPGNESDCVSSCESQMIEQQEDTARKRSLTEALKKLSHQQKEIIFLIYYNNITAQEAADIMSLSVRTVYNTAFNAIKQLRKELVSALILFCLLYYYKAWMATLIEFL